MLLLLMNPMHWVTVFNVNPAWGVGKGGLYRSYVNLKLFWYLLISNYTLTHMPFKFATILYIGLDSATWRRLLIGHLDTLKYHAGLRLVVDTEQFMSGEKHVMLYINKWKCDGKKIFFSVCENHFPPDSRISSGVFSEFSSVCCMFSFQALYESNRLYFTLYAEQHNAVACQTDGKMNLTFFSLSPSDCTEGMKLYEDCEFRYTL